VDARELFERIRIFPIAALGLAEDLLAGDFRSVFRGQGMEFDEVRRYEQGDDIRSIDWNVSARFGTPYVKQYREEKELSVFLLLDCSASMQARRGELSPFEQGILIFALLSFSAEAAGQPVGAIFFDEEITRLFKPNKGRPHMLTMVSAALAAASPNTAGSGSRLGRAIAGAERFLKRRSLVLVISDFFCINWEQELASLSRKHDVIAFRIVDPIDSEMLKAGLLRLEDPETGEKIEAPTGLHSFRTAWSLWHEERRNSWEAICRRAGAARLEISTSEDAFTALSRFFRGRRRR
jgi:uncharacterized protein (DUF58 family)